MKRVEIGEHLIVDPRVGHDKLTFKGTRVPVETILNRLANGRTVAELLTSWPELTREAIMEAITMASKANRRSMQPVEIGKYLVVDPRVCHGQLTFKGTRVPVETVLYWLSQGKTIETMFSTWPEIPQAAIPEAIQLASQALVAHAQNEARHEPVRRRRSTRPRSSA
jgi:uncharacterized protein (DUF433 family)